MTVMSIRDEIINIDSALEYKFEYKTRTLRVQTNSVHKVYTLTSTSADRLQEYLLKLDSR